MCYESELLTEEQYYLDTHFADPKNSNICPIAGRRTGVRGYERTDTVKAKQSAIAKTSEAAIAQRTVMSKANVGRPRSPATRKAISDGHKGIPKSDAHRKALSVAANTWGARKRAEAA